MKYKVGDLVTVVDIITDIDNEKECSQRYIGRVGEITSVGTFSLWPYKVLLWKITETYPEETFLFKEDELRLQ